MEDDLKNEVSLRKKVMLRSEANLANLEKETKPRRESELCERSQSW